jgi:hypothetical protein
MDNRRCVKLSYFSILLHIVLSILTSRPIYLLVSRDISALFFMALIMFGNKIPPPTKASTWFNSSLSSFSWTFSRDLLKGRKHLNELRAKGECIKKVYVYELCQTPHYIHFNYLATSHTKRATRKLPNLISKHKLVPFLSTAPRKHAQERFLSQHNWTICWEDLLISKITLSCDVSLPFCCVESLWTNAPACCWHTTCCSAGCLTTDR